MRLLNRNQVNLMTGLIQANQKATKQTMSKFLRQKYSKVTETKDYIYAEGDIPIALVAHMDTVFEQHIRSKDVFYDREQNVMFCPGGAGFDDKAGIFAIIQIIKRGLRPHIILTTDEEQGALGAEKLSQIKCPFSDLRYIIQLDRRGAIDCVFYNCYNIQFIDYVESFGFVEAIGSFSDISVICPEWKVAGVNLSIGYENEHTTSEILYVGHLLNTIDKVIQMLQAEEIPAFKYMPGYGYSWYRWTSPKAEDDNHCCFCKQEFASDELIPVKMRDFTTKHCCIDCIPGRVDFCNSCGEAYEVGPTNNKIGLCEDCLEDVYFKY